jgi:transposase InsO family protein
VAFEELKERLINAPILAYYDPTLATRVETDTSDGVLSAVLLQHRADSEWHPVAYFSKTMAPAERNYEIHDKELLAIVRALDEWRPELEGLQREDRFDILTDHQALEYFMSSKKLNSRQARWSLSLSRFHFRIRYRPGKQNLLADVLSRKDRPCIDEGRTLTLLPTSCLEDGVLPQNPLATEALEEVVETPLDAEIAPIEHRASEDIVKRVKTSNRLYESLAEDRELAATEASPRWKLRDRLLLYKERLVVPDDGDLRARLLDEVYRQLSVAHLGAEKMKRLVSTRYYWPGWAMDIQRYTDNCMICKRSKAWRDKTPGLLQPLPILERPWQHLTMDFRSFPKDRRGFDAVLVIVDRLSKRPISLPCYKTTNAKEMSQLFVDHVLRWTGILDSIVSDRGGQFVSEFWTEFCKILGIKRKLSTAYHPQTDGQSEIANQYMAQRLRPFINYYQDNWSELLAMTDLAAAALPQSTTKLSPFFIERGCEPRMSFDWQDTSPAGSLEACDARERAGKL